jgi:hypothetical protein
MPTAKTYLSWEVVEDVYTSNGRQYIKVKNPKNGSIKSVRWYTDKEYAKMYPEEKPATAKTYSQKELFGFDKGYITIFKGENSDWFLSSNARYCRLWGWYIMSTEEVPDDIPDNVTPVKLYWDKVGVDAANLKPEEEVKAIANSLMYDEGVSHYVGSVGESITATVTIEEVTILNTPYGRSTMFRMKDAHGVIYIWTTTAEKDWAEGDTKTITGTIKEYYKYGEECQNALTRCREIS